MTNAHSYANQLNSVHRAPGSMFKNVTQWRQGNSYKFNADIYVSDVTQILRCSKNDELEQIIANLAEKRDDFITNSSKEPPGMKIASNEIYEAIKNTAFPLVQKALGLVGFDDVYENEFGGKFTLRKHIIPLMWSGWINNDEAEFC